MGRPRKIGERWLSQGYWMVRVAGEPRSRHEHRVIMESIVGRRLSRGEHVHHINHNKSDNRPANLALLTSREHLRLHKPPLGRWSAMFDKCVTCGLTDSRHAAHGLCDRCNHRGTKGRHATKLARTRWHKDFDACADCGLTEVPHNARGLCMRCYKKRAYWRGRTRVRRSHLPA